MSRIADAAPIGVMGAAPDAVERFAGIGHESSQAILLGNHGMHRDIDAGSVRRSMVDVALQ